MKNKQKSDGKTHQIQKTDVEREARKKERRTYSVPPKSNSVRTTSSSAGKLVIRPAYKLIQTCTFSELSVGAEFLPINVFRKPVNADYYVKASADSFLDGQVSIPWELDSSHVEEWYPKL